MSVPEATGFDFAYQDKHWASSMFWSCDDACGICFSHKTENLTWTDRVASERGWDIYRSHRGWPLSMNEARHFQNVAAVQCGKIKMPQAKKDKYLAAAEAIFRNKVIFLRETRCWFCEYKKALEYDNKNK